jgi:hypothetical protein
MVFQSFRERNLDDALMYLSYERAILLVDGSACSDATSAGHIVEGTIFLFAKLVASSGATEEQKRSAIDRALAMEDATSSVRVEDVSICGMGLAAMGKALNVPDALAKPDGFLGSSQAASGRPSLYADNAIWRQKRSEWLPKLKSFLPLMMGIQVPQQ